MSTERYSVEVARLILAPVCGEYLSFDEAGVWIKADVLDSPYAHDVLRWTPACEMDWIGSPDPLTSPALPQNFTSKDFAALMLDGVVAQLEEVYGDFQNAPDSEALDGLGMRGGKAKQLLREAYTEFRNAMGRVGAPNAALTTQAQKLHKEYRQKRDDALERERVMEENSLGLPDSEYQEEYRHRLAIAVKPLAKLEVEMKRVAAEADAAWRAWVKAMVSDLLGPSLAGDSFRPETGKKQTLQEYLMPYLVQEFRRGRYANKKEFHRALVTNAGTDDSPFKAGSGKVDDLYVTSRGQKLASTTLGNWMSRVRVEAGK